MKRFNLILLLIAQIVKLFAQQTDASLSSDNTTNIATKPYSPTRAAAMFEALIDSKKGYYVDGTASGTDTYAVTVNSVVTAYNTGVVYRVKFTNANTSTTPTLNVNTIGAITIVDNAGSAIAVGDLKAGGTYDLQYDGTNLRAMNLGGSGGGGGLSGLVSGRITFTNSSTTITDDENLLWNDTTKLMTLGGDGGLTIFEDYNATTSNRDNLIFSDGMDDFSSVTGLDNFGASHSALYALTSGSHNQAIGAGAGSALTTADNNVLIGRITGATLVNGSDNVIVGAYSDVGAASGSNVILGRNNSGPTTGTGAVMVGNDLTIQSSSADDQLTIQNAIFGTGNAGSGTSVSLGNIGLYVTSPTARLHLPAGTATAGTAPLKFTTGTALTTPADGAMEYHSSHLYFTIGSTRYQLDQQGGGLSDADYGDITVGGSGTTMTIDNDAVTYAKMQNISAASRLLGRGSASGSGDTQEITPTGGITMSGTNLYSSLATLGKINVNAAVTGTTAETIIGSFLVPASSVEANDVLRFFIFLNKLSSVGNTTYKVYVNETNDLTTPTQIGSTLTTPGNVYMSMRRAIFMKNSVSSFEVVDPTNLVTPDDAIHGTQAISTVSYDLSAAFYFIVTVIPSNSGDTMTLHGVTLERLR